MNNGLTAEQFNAISILLEQDMREAIAQAAEDFNVTVEELIAHEDVDKKYLRFTPKDCTTNHIWPLDHAEGYYTIGRSFTLEAGKFAILSEARTVHNYRLFEDQYGNYYICPLAAKEF